MIWNIDIIKHIDTYLTNPLDSINFLKIVEPHVRIDDNINPIIYDILMISMNKILKYHQGDNICDNCKILDNYEECISCHKNLCEKCMRTERNYRSKRDFIDSPHYRKICGECYLNYSRDNKLWCYYCRNILEFDARNNKFCFKDCAACGSKICDCCTTKSKCIDYREHNFIRNYHVYKK